MDKHKYNHYFPNLNLKGTIQSAYKSAKEALAEGKTGTDDFQTMAKFLNSKAVKQHAEEGGKYAADAYQKAFQEAMATADRWFGDDEADSMKNFVEDFKNKGLWNVTTDDMGLWDIQKNFNTTAEAADKFGMSVESVETMLHGLEAYGYDFSDVMFSAEGLDEYKTALDGIKSTYDEMTDGAAKDRLGSLIDGFESEYDKFQNGDLKDLTKDQIVKIKFEYDLSQVEQKTQELIDQAANSGSNNDLAGAIVSQKKERDLLEGQTKYTKDSDEGYSYSFDQIDKLQQKMTNATKKERAEINKQILAYQEMQNNFQKYRLDGGDLNWNDYLDTPSATAAFDEIIKKGLMTKDQLKDLFGENATYEVDAKLNDVELRSKISEAVLSIRSISRLIRSNFVSIQSNVSFVSLDESEEDEEELEEVLDFDELLPEELEDFVDDLDDDFLVEEVLDEVFFFAFVVEDVDGPRR